MNKEVALCLKEQICKCMYIHAYIQKTERGRQWDTETIELSSIANQII